MAVQYVHEGLPVDASGGTGGYYTAQVIDPPTGTDVLFDESGLTVETRGIETICPMGYYCQGGLRRKCPPVCSMTVWWVWVGVGGCGCVWVRVRPP